MFRVLVLWFFLSLSSVPARAEMASLFGIGPMSQSMGGVALVEGENTPFEVYSAPAALGYLRNVEIDFGTAYFQPNIRSYGTLNLNANGTKGDFNDAGVLPGGGSVIALGIPLGPRHPVTLGAAFYVPYASLIRVSSTPVDYPFYPLYTDLSRNLFFVIGAGYEFINGYALGINVRSVTKSTVSYVLRSDSSVNYSASATESKSESHLSYSFLYDNSRRHPEHKWTAGAMYRAYAGMETKLQADVTAFVPVQGVLITMPAYTPAEWVIMGSWKPLPGFTISNELSRVMWSAYTSPYGSGNINAYVINGSSAPAQFHDIWVPRIGFEENFPWPKPGKTVRRMFVREGYQYHPSPVPDQTGDSNFVDNDRHMFSFGLGAALANPFNENDIINLDIFYQYNLLKNRRINKTSTTAVGAPGYDTGGNIMLFGMGLGLKF